MPDGKDLFNAVMGIGILIGLGVALLIWGGWWLIHLLALHLRWH